MGPAPFATHAVGTGLIAAYRGLVAAEARLAEAGHRPGASVADQWPTLHHYLRTYARLLSPAGVVVFGGAPDAGSRATGLPFTGPQAARERLGLDAAGEGESPQARAFWDAVALAAPVSDAAPLHALFSTVHLALARPFDVAPARAVMDASARHVLRVLEAARPQAAVAVGGHALEVLARALGDARVRDLAASPEEGWCRHWPAGTRLLAYPYVEVPAKRPFRVRLVPVPALDGPHADLAVSALGGVLAYAWGA